MCLEGLLLLFTLMLGKVKKRVLLGSCYQTSYLLSRAAHKKESQKCLKADLLAPEQEMRFRGKSKGVRPRKISPLHKNEGADIPCRDS